MLLDDAADELYEGSPDDFVERRTALVARARAAKDRLLVKQIGALRRPTRTAWLLNRLAREDGDGVAQLLGLGEALADAQRRGSGPDLRRLSEERRQLVDQLVRTTVRIGSAHGWTATDTNRQEVGQTLQAALSDPGTGEQLRRGRLTAAVSYGGFGPADLTAALAASLPAAAPAPVAAPQVREPEPEPDPEAERRREQQALAAAAEQVWQDAAAELVRTQQEAEQLTERADALADRVAELQAALAEAGTVEAAARDQARTARRRQQEAGRAVTEAEAARTAALAALGS